MNNTLISVVMPVYNTEKSLLLKAVDSVISQTYRPIELIIVDDGSKEECSKLCDELKSCCELIRVIHQPNIGVSAARNNGTKAAIGKYITYVDSDDILAPYALNEGMKVISETGAQFVFAGVQWIRRYEEFQPSGAKDNIEYKCYKGAEIDIVRASFLTQRNPDFLNIDGVGAVQRGPIARLIEADIAKAVLFDETLVLGEDVEWNMRILNACDVVSFARSVWYGYLTYGNSSLRRYRGDRAALLEKYLIKLRDNNISFYKENLGDFAVNTAVVFYSMVKFEYLSKECSLSRAEKVKEIKDILARTPWNMMNNRKAWKSIPPRYKLFIISCKFGIGIDLLSIWKEFKSES